jgi:hypothetical protein
MHGALAALEASHVDLGAVEMHVFPAEIRHLADTQAVAVSDQDHCRVAVWVAAGLLDRLTQVLDLRFGQKPRGFSPLSRRLHVLCGLAGL